MNQFIPTAISNHRSVNIIALPWAIVGLVLAAVYATSDWQATAGVLMISQAFTGRLVWSRFSRLQLAILPDFLSLLLLYQLGTKTLTLLGIVVRAGGTSSGIIGETLSLVDIVELEYQFQAELIFLLATMVFTGVWRLQEGNQTLALLHEPSTKVAWTAYFISLFTVYILTILGLGSGLGLVEELLHLFSIGALAVLINGTSVYGLGRSRSWLIFLALIPLLISALQSGMKAEVGLVFFPILLPIIQRASLKRFALAGFFLLFVVLFVFPFSEAWREANWQGGLSSNKWTIGEVASDVTDLWERRGLVETAQVSTSKWLMRGSSAQQGGLVMKMAEQNSLIGPVLIQGLATIFVPRFLWPNKPTYAPGAWFTWYLGQAESPETATTSTAMMLPTELYWMFGLLGVICGMSLIAVLNFRVWQRLLRESSTGVIPTFALFAMIARASGLEEIHTIYAISSPIILIVYVIVLDRFMRVILSGLK